MTFPPLRLLQFRESRFGCPRNARVISAEELGTMSKNNLGVITLGRVRLGYSGIRIYSGIYSGYSALGSRIAGMEIQVFRNENSSQTNAYSYYSNYSYSGLIPSERALSYTLLP